MKNNKKFPGYSLISKGTTSLKSLKDIKTVAPSSRVLKLAGWRGV